MIADVLAVMWKEGKELLVQHTTLRGGIIRLIIVIGIFGVFLPLQVGPGIAESPILAAFSAAASFFLVRIVIPDSFAGERERHTLETLLASRLPDRAILLGKAGASVAYGWGLTLACLLICLVTVNIAYWNGGLLIYTPAIGLWAVVFGLLSAGLAAGLGVLISLRASTLQQAHQNMMISFFIFVLAPTLGYRTLPHGWKTRLAEASSALSQNEILFIVAAAVLVLDTVLLALAMARFKRHRLICERK